MASGLCRSKVLIASLTATEQATLCKQTLPCGSDTKRLHASAYRQA